MKRKFWNWIKNEDESVPDMERTIFLNGMISDETWYGDEVTPQLFKDELNAGNGNITVWINSPGGDVFAAAQIYNMLRDYKGSVTVKIDGIAASAASVIAMAGDTVCVSPVAMMMIHNPATMAMGETRDMQKAIAMLNEVKESILNAYEFKTGLTRARLSHMMDDETWFNAKKAVELRIERHMTQEQVATKLQLLNLDITRSVYSQIENGTYNIRISILAGLAQIFQVDYNCFFRDVHLSIS